MRETDRRVIYTKRILRSSLMKLLEEKHISKISVTELCSCAGVNRGTFYSHYRQPEDVMRHMEDDLIAEIESVLESETDMTVIHRKMLNILELNRGACKVLFGDNGDPECVKRVLGLSEKYFKNTWQTTLNLSEDMVKYMHSFVFAGTVQVLRDWILNDDVRTAAEIADILSALQKYMLRAM